jgi:outer membrane protein insertion porin family
MNPRTFFPALTMLFAVMMSSFVGRPLEAQPAPAGPIVKSIDVQYAGATTIAREKVLANMQTRVGRPYDERTVEDDIRNLYAMGNVTNVRIFGEPTADGVRVIVVIQAKAQINEVLINGPARLKPGRVRKQISAKPGDSLNEAALEADRQKIIDYYAGKGFTEADVRYTVEQNERAGTARVTFTVSEGDKVRIRSVSFEGNTVLKDREIKKVIQTKPKGLLNLFAKAAKVSNDQPRATLP